MLEELGRAVECQLSLHRKETLLNEIGIIFQKDNVKTCCARLVRRLQRQVRILQEYNSDEPPKLCISLESVCGKTQRQCRRKNDIK